LLPGFALQGKANDQLSLLFQLNARYSKTPSPIAVYDGEGWYTSRAVITPQIPFDLAYSMTSFKAQVALFNA
jgi:hypothetical protein